MKKLFWWLLPWIFYCGLIFFLSSLSSPPSPVSFPISDKIIHAFEYLILAILTVRAFHKWPGGIFGYYYLIGAIIFCILYAASDEWHQSFVASRVPDVMDLVADVIGIAIGVLLYHAYYKYYKR